jgi:hypothetical protein
MVAETVETGLWMSDLPNTGSHILTLTITVLGRDCTSRPERRNNHTEIVLHRRVLSKSGSLLPSFFDQIGILWHLFHHQLLRGLKFLDRGIAWITLTQHSDLWWRRRKYPSDHVRLGRDKGRVILTHALVALVFDMDELEDILVEYVQL